MNNYFNTPSSFGFTTESSYNADPVSARSNISHLSGINRHLNESHQLVEEYEAVHQAEQDHDQNEETNYRREDIYIGLTNIRKNKTLIILSLIWEAKQTYFKLLAFYQIKASSKPKKSVQYTGIYPLILRYSKYQPKLLKNQAFDRLKRNMKQQRTKQLKILSIFGHISNKKNELLRAFYFILKNQLENDRMGQLTEGRQAQVKKDLAFKPLNKFVITNMKLGCKLLKLLKVKNFCFSFNRIKYFKNRIKANELLPFKKTTTTNTYKSMLQNLPVPMGSFSYSKNKMSKNTNKIAQYKIDQKKNAKQLYNLVSVIKCMILKKKKAFMQAFKNCWEPFSAENEEIEKDDPNINTNILKHICWLSSRQAMKLELKNKNISEQLTKSKVKALMLALKRKERCQLKYALGEWRKHTINQRMQVMNRVKQLQNLKQMYIENYK